MYYSIVVAYGDHSQIPPHNNPNHPPAPTSALFRFIKNEAKNLGRFPQNHPLQGQQRMVVLKVNENFTSQIPSCWASGHPDNIHPNLPNQVPDRDQRMRKFRGKWKVLECPFCHTKYHRDWNACM